MTDVALSSAADNALLKQHQPTIKLSIRTSVLPGHKQFTSMKTLTLRA